MNLFQLKQYLQNNMLYGENSHNWLRPSVLASQLLQPDYSKQWFIDISHWDGGAVQLGVTKSLGCSGVWIKGVDGSLNSRHFPENYATAVSVGLPRSAYAWLYRDVNVRAISQAQAFDTLLNKYPPSPELLPWIDFESTKYGGVQSNPDFTDLRKWLVEWLRLGNPSPIVYSGKYYMDQFGQMPSDIKGMIAGIAIANYSSSNPPLPLGFTDWIYHQWTSSGDAMLIAPNNVNKLEVDLIYGHGAVTPPPEVGMFYGRNKTSLTNIRSGAGGTFSDIGDLLLNDLVEADRRQDVSGSIWWHLTKITRNGANVPLPGPECWAWGTNIEEILPPTRTITDVNIKLASGSIVTTKYSDGTVETVTA